MWNWFKNLFVKRKSSSSPSICEKIEVFPVTNTLPEPIQKTIDEVLCEKGEHLKKYYDFEINSASVKYKKDVVVFDNEIFQVAVNRKLMEAVASYLVNRKGKKQ